MMLEQVPGRAAIGKTAPAQQPYLSAWPYSMPTSTIARPPFSAPLSASEDSQHSVRQQAAPYENSRQMFPLAAAATAVASSADVQMSRHAISTSRVATATTGHPLAGAAKPLGISKTTLERACCKLRLTLRQEELQILVADELEKRFEICLFENRRLQQLVFFLQHDLHRVKWKGQQLSLEQSLAIRKLDNLLTRFMVALQA